MKTHSLTIASVLTFALAAAGCRGLSKKSEAEAAASATATTAAAAVAASAAPAAAAAPEAEVADEAIAASEDFEDEAFAKITDKTYKTDLEALRKEIEEP